MMLQFVRVWHRRLGMLTALLLIMLSVTGILLNHTHDLQLDKRYLQWPWLLAHYNIEQIKADKVYRFDQQIVSQFAQQIFIEDQFVVQNTEMMVGAMSLGDINIIAFPNSLYLFSQQGELIEKMDQSVGVPPQIQNIGSYHGLPVLQTRYGMWRGDEVLEQWEAITVQGVSWSQAAILPKRLTQRLTQYFYGQGVSIEQLVLDLHNGNILADLGRWLLDAVAIFIIIIALSGMIIWSRRGG